MNGSTNKATPPVHYAILLYQGFQALDAFGPLDVLNFVGKDDPRITLSILGPTLDPVSTLDPRPGQKRNISVCQRVFPTHTYDDPPENIDVLLVPGGAGNREPKQLERMAQVVRELYPRLQYIFSVCTGAKILAKSGILDGKTATSNKYSFHEVLSLYNKVNWVHKARWASDGNIWTSSGVTAGIDGMLALIEHIYDKAKADLIADYLEHVRHKEASDDPFAERFPLPEGHAG